MKENTNFEFETIIFDSRTKQRRTQMVWLNDRTHAKRRANTLYISNDLADALNINDDQIHRFDIQVSKDGQTFALHFNPVGLCNMKEKRCVNIHLCDIISAKLSLVYKNTISIKEFDAYADPEHSRIIFTPIVVEDK